MVLINLTQKFVAKCLNWEFVFVSCEKNIFSTKNIIINKASNDRYKALIFLECNDKKFVEQ
jgi:hypothetical protein